MLNSIFFLEFLLEFNRSMWEIVLMHFCWLNELSCALHAFQISLQISLPELWYTKLNWLRIYQYIYLMLHERDGFGFGGQAERGKRFKNRVCCICCKLISFARCHYYTDKRLRSVVSMFDKQHKYSTVPIGSRLVFLHAQSQPWLIVHFAQHVCVCARPMISVLIPSTFDRH